MRRTARKTSTQSFTEIVEISDSIVVVSGGNAAIVIEVTATNFTLQSSEEQMARIASYGALLNSLSFPIQIIIRSKKVDISSYLKSLEDEAKKVSNKTISQHILDYKNFVSELTHQNSVLDKRFYIAIPFSYLEKGALKAASSVGQKSEDFAKQARIVLRSKADVLIGELARTGLKARILGKDELVALFHGIYNGAPVETGKIAQEGRRPIFTK